MPADPGGRSANPPSSPPYASVRPRRRPALGSFAAAGVGWLTLFGFGFFAVLFEGPDALAFLILGSVIYAGIILAVWLLVLWPLYAFVPRRSALWSWPVCTLCGLLGGTLTAFLILLGGNPSAFHQLLSRDALLGCAMLGGVVGAVTCLFGSLTASYFLGPLPGRPVPGNLSAVETPAVGTPTRHGEPRLARSKQIISWLKRKFLQISGQ